jgi:serine/threonine-protein kinase HipA
MIVNLLLLNTDDHLQNFAMLHTEKGWELSPTYDIVPNIYQPSQLLSVNGKHLDIIRTDVILDGERFGFSASRSASLLDDVISRILIWEDIFQTCGVPARETSTLQENIRVAFNRLVEV